MNTFTSIFIIMLTLATVIQLWLINRQYKRVSTHRGEVPTPFNDKIPLEAHQKAADYTIAKIRVERIDLVYSAVILLGWTLGGGLDLLDTVWRNLELSPVVTFHRPKT